MIKAALVIAGKGGALEIDSLQSPGKSIQTVDEFLRGFPIEIGSVFN